MRIQDLTGGPVPVAKSDELQTIERVSRRLTFRHVALGSLAKKAEAEKRPEAAALYKEAANGIWLANNALRRAAGALEIQHGQ